MFVFAGIFAALRAVFVALGIFTTVVGVTWGLIYAGVSFLIMRYRLHIDYNAASSTAFLIGATAFFERSHVEHTARMTEERVSKMLSHFTHQMDEKLKEDDGDQRV